MPAHKEFVHLHLHSDYSLLDGACRIEPLIEMATQFRMPAIGLTDHGNLFGAIQFHDQAVKRGIKPIIGCEVYVARGSRLEKGGRTDYANHLILLAENQTGYRNLVKLVSLAYLEGFYYRPRIDRELLSQYHEGLIAMSACLKGSVPAALLSDDYNGAAREAGILRDIMGPNNFFLELQFHNLDAQKKVNPELLKLSKATGIPLVATNDCHYLRADDYEAHDVLLCIQTGKTVNEENRMRYTSSQFYFKSPEEMYDLFGSIPESLTNTLAISERCNLRFDDSRLFLPDYQVPSGETLDSYFERIVRGGFQERVKVLEEMNSRGRLRYPLTVYRERLDFEIAMIRKMGLAGYFLIVWDFIRFARENRIPVGPGRGSAAGSLVSYSLRITDLDPLQYNLLFERFLNPERISLPDIDIDFCMRRRGEVIDYVTRKYGRENVSQIITFGTMAARGVVRDVGRGLDIPYAEVDRIAKLIPAALDTTLEKALATEPGLKEADKEPHIHKLLEIAKRLEGLARHSSMHAAGVVIAPKPLIELVPLYKSNKDEIMTQFPMTDLERIGRLKMDFLALATLTVIDDTLQEIEHQFGQKLVMETLPLDDDETYKLFADGRTGGIFQFESSGMKDALRRVKPERFEDLIALNALFRPGPMAFIDEYARRKHGQVKVQYELPEMEDILKETHGIIVYQEQVMQIASKVAGFSLAEADILRKAMGKKMQDVMEAQHRKFIAGAKANGVAPATAEKIFDLIREFAKYGFNKSHSTAYALLAYQTGYLKVHYPVQFLSSLLTNEIGNTDKIVQYIGEAKGMGIGILPPDINKSQVFFSGEEGNIRFGLAAIRNVGESAIRSILGQRNSIGRFQSFTDFCEKVDHRVVNKRVIESLIKAGTFDSIGYRRAQIFDVIDRVIEGALMLQRDRESGQKNLFGAHIGKVITAGQPEDLPELSEWSESVRLAFEKEALGFYISGHPLQRFEQLLKECSQWTVQDLRESEGTADVSVGGVVVAPRFVKTKKGEPMATFQLEDLTGSVEVVVFPSLLAKRRELVAADRPVIVRGRFEQESEKVIRILASEIDTIEGLKERVAKALRIRTPLKMLSEESADRLMSLLKKNSGDCGVGIELLQDGGGRIRIESEQFVKVKPSIPLIQEIERICGEGSVHLAV